MKKLIIFDCDGTLIDSEIIAAQVFPEVWATMGLKMSVDDFICTFVGTSSDADEVKETLSKLPAHAMQVADALFEERLEKDLEAISGMADLISSLAHQTCVASNSSAPYLQKVLKKTGLLSHFENRVYSARDVGRAKPEPDVFLHAAKVLGFEPIDCLVIEDSLPGIRAAQAAGMPVIGFMGGLHCNPVVRHKLLSGRANGYCSSAHELKQLIQNHLD